MQITVGFSSHRIEVLRLMEREMKRHDIILLEEPHDPIFEEMLREEMDIGEYLERGETSFPKFSKEMCKALRRLYKEGKVIEQVEPYLQYLQGLYEIIERGGRLSREALTIPQRKVFSSEQRTTKALLEYYEAVRGDFDGAVKAVKEFARADAERMELRERMRAESIADKIKRGEYEGDTYIEAGSIHVMLPHHLKRELGGYPVKVKPCFLLEKPSRAMTGGRIRQPLSPGDVLTLRYMCGVEGGKEDILAARSLIYVKLLNKDEMLPSKSMFPHLEEEIELIEFVGKLGYEDCEKLFKVIKFLDREEALKMTNNYFL